METAVNNN